MATDFFLKIDGIEGEAQDSKHKNEIQIESWSYSSDTGSVRRSGTGAVVHDAQFTALMSKASPKIFLACCNGTKISKAVLTARKQGGTQEDFFKVTFSDVLVTAHRIGGKARNKGTIPLEEFSFNFAKINFDYRLQKQDGALSGSVSSSYNVKEEQGQGQ
jgi:type VI secretion system secreted protein Hcp